MRKGEKAKGHLHLHPRRVRSVLPPVPPIAEGNSVQLQRPRSESTNGNDVSNSESVSSTRESPIRNASDIQSQSSSDDHTRRLQHLRHSYSQNHEFRFESSAARRDTWSSLRSKIPQNDDSLLSLLDRLLFDGESDIVLVIEYSSFSFEFQSFLSSDLRYTSSRRQVSSKNSAPDRTSAWAIKRAEQKTNRM